MSPLLDLMDPEWLWTLIILVSGAAGAWLGWKLDRSELKELRIKIEVLEQTTVKAEDWSEMSARQTVIERLTAKLMDEWEAGEDAPD